MNEQKFFDALNKAIKFHQENQNDPHGVGNAVICALTEVRNAFAQAAEGSKPPHSQPPQPEVK